ncbi:hypothetical protein Acr_29g0011990 [Actinidia rufa]|uniref:Uncharacterized protein n=1 Tax=Actinidia rufa TaxID=165716 RepID=A0A7J0HFX1_9ERIC|nr:hypothetical protein Acr_29g0011990 [Actinidia rufa]
MTSPSSHYRTTKLQALSRNFPTASTTRRLAEESAEVEIGEGDRRGAACSWVRLEVDTSTMPFNSPGLTMSRRLASANVVVVVEAMPMPMPLLTFLHGLVGGELLEVVLGGQDKGGGEGSITEGVRNIRW